MLIIKTIRIPLRSILMEGGRQKTAGILQGKAGPALRTVPPAAQASVR